MLYNLETLIACFHVLFIICLVMPDTLKLFIMKFNIKQKYFGDQLSCFRGQVATHHLGNAGLDDDD